MFPPNFWIEEKEKFYRETENLIIALFLRGAIDGEDFLKPYGLIVLMDWDVVNTNAVQYVQGVHRDIIDMITETTQDQVYPLIDEWLKSGEAMPKLIKRLEDVGYPEHRAEMIAVTEVTRAVNAGNQAAWESTGYITAKQWTTAEDERVCPVCKGMHGKIADIKADFKLDMSDVQGEDDPLGKFLAKHGGQITEKHPPAHPRCRCSMRPVFYDDEALIERADNA